MMDWVVFQAGNTLVTHRVLVDIFLFFVGWLTSFGFPVWQ